MLSRVTDGTAPSLQESPKGKQHTHVWIQVHLWTHLWRLEVDIRGLPRSLSTVLLGNERHRHAPSRVALLWVHMLAWHPPKPTVC